MALFSVTRLSPPLHPSADSQGTCARRVTVCERQMRKILNVCICNYRLLSVWDCRFPLYRWATLGKLWRGGEVVSGVQRKHQHRWPDLGVRRATAKIWQLPQSS